MFFIDSEKMNYSCLFFNAYQASMGLSLVMDVYYLHTIQSPGVCLKLPFQVMMVIHGMRL